MLKLMTDIRNAPAGELWYLTKVAIGAVVFGVAGLVVMVFTAAIVLDWLF